MYLWAGVCFTALGGRTADFLQRAAAQNFKLREILPVFGGVSAQCSASRYRALAALAKSCHVRLHVTTRQGLYFRVRGLFERRGIWCALVVFCVFYACNRNLIWQIDYSALTEGQEARVSQILWESCEIAPGAYYSEALLASGEAALLADTDEFSWVSLNFAGGRVTVEVSQAVAVPEIAEGTQGDITAHTAGQVVSVNVQQGTAMVGAGDMVEIGQVLIGQVRLEHDEETLVYELTAGEVLAECVVDYTAEIDYSQRVLCPVTPLGIETDYIVFAFGRRFAVSDWFTWTEWSNQDEHQDDSSDASNGVVVSSDLSNSADVTTRNISLSMFGFCLPVTICEENTLHYTVETVRYTQTEALALARLACSEALYTEYPDALILEESEIVQASEECLSYTIYYKIVADIGSSPD